MLVIVLRVVVTFRTARGRLQCAREDRRLGVREIRMGHGSRGQQGWTLATATRTM